MKQILVCICLLSGMNSLYSMDKTSQSAALLKKDNKNAFCCYFVSSVPACHRCVTKRNNSNPVSTTPQARAEAVTTVSAKNDLSKSREMIRCP